MGGCLGTAEVGGMAGEYPEPEQLLRTSQSARTHMDEEVRLDFTIDRNQETNPQSRRERVVSQGSQLSLTSAPSYFSAVESVTKERMRGMFKAGGPFSPRTASEIQSEVNMLEKQPDIRKQTHKLVQPVYDPLPDPSSVRPHHGKNIYYGSALKARPARPEGSPSMNGKPLVRKPHRSLQLSNESSPEESPLLMELPIPMLTNPIAVSTLGGKARREHPGNLSRNPKDGNDGKPGFGGRLQSRSFFSSFEDL